MERISHKTLREFATDIVVGWGSPPEIASEIADALVRADLGGHSSHGVRLLPSYHEQIAAGRIEPESVPITTPRGETGFVDVAVDGNSAFGQITGRLATDHCVETARENGTAVVGVRNGTHLGRIGEFAERAARRGVLFACFVNGPGIEPVAPFGSADHRLSTNPIAFAVPTFDALPFPIMLDMATSQVALGKIKRRAAEGGQIPPSWTTTADGDPVCDPETFLEGPAALLPLGGRATGHKGFGLSVIAELFAGITGSHVVDERETDWGNGAFLLAIDLNDRAEKVERKVSTVAGHLRSATPISKADDLLLPGEYEHRTRNRREADGIPIPVDDADALVTLAETLGIGPVPKPLRTSERSG